MMMRMAVLIVLGVMTSHASAEIYRCKGPNGVVFSDKPCGQDAEKIGVAAPAPAPTSPTPANEKASAVKKLKAECAAGQERACVLVKQLTTPVTFEQLEQEAKEACERGDLSVCQSLYCEKEMTTECRAQLSKHGRLTGQGWYQYSNPRRNNDGATIIDIRCMRNVNGPSRLSFFCRSNGCTSMSTAYGARTFATVEEGADELCVR